MKKYIPFFLISLFIFMGIPFSFGSSEDKGVVVAIRNGQLDRRLDELWQRMKVREDVYFQDHLRTSERAVAVLDVAKTGRMVLGPGSNVILGKKVDEYEVSTKRGAVWLRTKLKRGSKMKIRTDVATVSVRGTKFAVIVDDEGVDVCTCTGEVDVTKEDGNVIEVPRGMFLPIEKNGTSPQRAESSHFLLKRVGTGKKERYNFCMECHLTGGRGELKRGIRSY